MKKISLGILLLSATLLFGCQNQLAELNTSGIDKTTIATQPVAANPDEIKWNNFDKKFIKLSGIKYPDSFWLETNNSGEEFTVFDRLEIKSSKKLDMLNCDNTSTCERDGMLISIFSSKETVSYRDAGLNLIDNTKYPNIKKIRSANDSNANGVITNKYIFIPNNPDDIAYQITFTERNFDGDSAAIIDGILGSLHEE